MIDRKWVLKLKIPLHFQSESANWKEKALTIQTKVFTGRFASRNPMYPKTDLLKSRTVITSPHQEKRAKLSFIYRKMMGLSCDFWE